MNKVFIRIIEEHIYILMMGIPSAVLFIAMVWFPYDKLSLLVGTNVLFFATALKASVNLI